MAIGDPLNAGIGVYNPNIKGITTPGVSALDEINKRRALKGMPPIQSGGLASPQTISGQTVDVGKKTGAYYDMLPGLAEKIADLAKPPSPQVSALSKFLVDDPALADSKFSATIGQFKSPNIFGSDADEIFPDQNAPLRASSDPDEIFMDSSAASIMDSSAASKSQKRPDESEAEFNARIENEERGIFDGTSTTSTATGGGTTTGGGKSGEQINKDLYQGLLDQSLKSYNEAVGMAPPEAQTMQQYKDEFSKATGIDISGDPDNKAALTAFGLALMQNKAGKGFNVGNMLSEVGAAGEKALPLMEQARREAREAQVAAGKYALTEGKTATATRQKFLVDQATYLRDRRDTILGAQVARINQIEDREDKQEAAATLASVKTRYDTAVKEIEWRQDAEKRIAEGKEIKSMLKQTPISGNKQYVMHKGMPKAGGQLVLTDAENDATKFGRGYGNILEAQNTVDNSIRILTNLKNAPAGSAVGQIFQEAQSLFSTVVKNPKNVFEDIAIYNTDGTITMRKNISERDLLKSMRNGIISEYKRFLTQETGNGISEGDVKRIEALLGNPEIFTNVEAAIAGLQEARGIFDNSRKEFEDSLKQFTNRNNYDSDEAFKLGSASAQKGIFYGIGDSEGRNYEGSFVDDRMSKDDDGIPIFDLTR